MSINPQFQGHDQYDVMMGSVTSHFSQIDNVLLKNECINGQYQMVTQASYAANTPVDSPGFTTVCISTNGALIADLENSYITAKIKYYFTMADLPDDGFTKAKIDAEAGAGVSGRALLRRYRQHEYPRRASGPADGTALRGTHI